MDLAKQSEYFNPINITDEIHIIGLGAIGSTLAEQLARMGFTNFYIYDFDIVEAKNLVNQNFFISDLSKSKIGATINNIKNINAEATIYCHEHGYENQPLKGYVFLCVDSIELRHKIAEENKYNLQIKAMFDFRMRCTDAQHYATKWNDYKKKENFIKSMEFTSEEAKEATPVNACGGALNVRYTVTTIVSYGVANFISLLKFDKLKSLILIDMESFDLTCM